MSGQQGPEPIGRRLTVPLAVERAFARFTAEMASWWPREYTWSGEVLVDIGVEPRQGGHCYEIGPFDFHCDWGRVLIWEPPDRLVLAWQISPRREPEPNPDRASKIEVRFVPQGPAETRVEFEHRGFERHGQAGVEYRAALDSPQGWTYILERFAATAS